MLNPAKFVREVRQEMNKVTWPSRKETTVSTTMVLIMVVISALFFLVVDWTVSNLVKIFLGM